MDQPRQLSEDEWARVIEIASNYPEIAEQINNDNIKELGREWVGYSGQPGFVTYFDSALISGVARPHKGLWYYPAILFIFRSRIDNDAGGRLVAVDIETGRVVFSMLEGLLPPPPLKPRPPG
jgi:hypothetical protein